MRQRGGGRDADQVPLWLLAFCFALMGPAMGINAVLVATAVPAMVPLGLGGLVAAGCVGVVLGVVPAVWLARRIHAGIREDR